MRFLTNLFVDVLGIMPEPIIWRFAKKYIAGSELRHGLEVQADLHAANFTTTMDILGEDSEVTEDAEKSVVEYEKLIAGVAKSGIPSNISVKLTQMGLTFEPDTTAQRIQRLAELSAENGLFFRIDIEDSTTTDITFEIYRNLRKKIPRVGTAVQAYMKRTVNDVDKMLNEGPTDLRICKGIYKEHPDIAFRDRQEIRKNFMTIIRQVMDGGGYPAIATHDDWVIDESLKEIKKRDLKPEQYEFQMLYGVGEKLRKQLIADGHRVRVYIPFGDAWKAYSLRRFRENPTLGYYVIKNIFLPR